ncbi:hypothetical protein [Microcoleus sp. herbarium14]|uniref:hypothetical protein n=1 Tax=Microcoleus sp. herbarium14 TaxID=3055439 RepID=UPI002FD364E7
MFECLDLLIGCCSCGEGDEAQNRSNGILGKLAAPTVKAIKSVIHQKQVIADSSGQGYGVGLRLSAHLIFLCFIDIFLNNKLTKINIYDMERSDDRQGISLK